MTVLAKRSSIVSFKSAHVSITNNPFQFLEKTKHCARILSKNKSEFWRLFILFICFQSQRNNILLSAGSLRVRSTLRSRRARLNMHNLVFSAKLMVWIDHHIEFLNGLRLDRWPFVRTWIEFIYSLPLWQRRDNESYAIHQTPNSLWHT